MTPLEFIGWPTEEPTGAALIECPDAWPLYPVLPLHRDEAECGVLIAAPGYPIAALILVNVCDPRLRRILAFEQLDDDGPAFITYALRLHVLEDGWAVGEQPGWGLEHLRDWDRRTEPCPECDGRGYKGAATLAIPCARCEASGTVRA